MEPCTWDKACRQERHADTKPELDSRQPIADVWCRGFSSHSTLQASMLRCVASLFLCLC